MDLHVPRVEELSVYGWWPRTITTVDRFLGRQTLVECSDISLSGDDFRRAVRAELEGSWHTDDAYFNFFTDSKEQNRIETLAFASPDGLILGVMLDDASPNDLLRESQWLLELGTSLLLVEPGRPPPQDFEEFVTHARRGWEWIFED